MGTGGKKKLTMRQNSDKKGKKEKKPRDMVKAAEYAAISKSRTRMKNSAEYQKASEGRKAELLAADKQRVLRLRGQGTGVRGAWGGGGGGAVAVGVGGGGGGVAVPSGGFGHFAAGFGPNHHQDEEDEEEEEGEEDEEEEEDDDLLRQLGELVARFPEVDPLIILHQVCQWLGINPPALPPQ
ncbi:hypothetical protein NA56DRAFT_653751 [Hyaloscypha hepaticicola]|uniref:Uncharacterized protein n=1 Tax=Hyaloscypha hepaticicola TaxID=2082293 RepID=A0A2J6QNX2_9HELO|nr:hypothetical protein NA56DRAFT_653751 [Hyaloscypha hepaticicola]